MGVMQEPIDGSGRQRFGHQLVEAGRMHVRAHRHRAFFIGGVHQPVEALRCIWTHWQQADVIHHDQPGAQDGAHRSGH